jgi:hypothetical protein
MLIGVGLAGLDVPNKEKVSFFIFTDEKGRAIVAEIHH